MALPTEIATMADCLAHLGMGTTATDAEIGRLQTIKQRAEMSVRKYLQMQVTQATYTHYLPRGNPFDIRVGRFYHSEQLVLPEAPLRSITSINEDGDGRFGQLSGAFTSDSLLTAGSDYYFPQDATGFCKLGTVYRVNTKWLAIPGSIKIVYVAGWTADELRGNVADPTTDAAPIMQAVLQTVSEYWNDHKQAAGGDAGAAGPIKSESLADYSVEYDTRSSGPAINLTPEVKAVLNGYKRIQGYAVR